jgi:hypothetical protein
MRRVRRLLGLDEPQETRFFLLLSAYGIVIGIVYWFLTYEVAGSLLLLAFGIAPGLLALRLVIDPGSRRVRRAAEEHERAGGQSLVPDSREGTGGGTGEIDRPFLDESGRLPSPTLAPFAVALGVSVIVTGILFGPAPVVVGILPFAWGAWTWFRGASDEFRAVAADGTSADATSEERPPAATADEAASPSR